MPPASYESQNVRLEYAGSGLPDNIKLLKTVSLFPVELTAVGSLNPRTRSWSYCLGARDTIINGRMTYSKDDNAIVWRKSLPLPVFGGLTRPVLAASWQLGRGQWRRPPRLQLGLAVDESHSAVDDGATLGSDGNVGFRKKVFLTRRWGVEVDGDMRLHLATDLLGGGGGLANGTRFELTAREVNVVLRV